MDMKNGEAILKRGIQAVHEAFADYLLLNPGATLRQMGAVFGYSIGWISRVLNSDMFKAYLATRRDHINHTIATDMPAKLAALSELAVERMTEVLENTNDPELIVDSFDRVMHRFGYAPNAKTAQQPQGPNVQNNVFFLTPQQLGSAREKLLQAHTQGAEALPSPVDQVLEVLPESATKAS